MKTFRGEGLHLADREQMLSAKTASAGGDVETAAGSLAYVYLFERTGK